MGLGARREAASAIPVMEEHPTLPLVLERRGQARSNLIVGKEQSDRDLDEQDAALERTGAHVGLRGVTPETVHRTAPGGALKVARSPQGM